MDWRICTITLVAMLSFQNNAFSYPTPVDFDGKILRWNINKDDNTPIYYYIEADSTSDLRNYESIVEQAADIWTEVASSYFVYERTLDPNLAQTFVHLDNDQGGNSASSGYATFSFDDSGYPTSCEIHVAISLSGIDKTVLHELGHCVGLGHSLIGEAIMSYDVEKNGFWLDVDDVAAISRIYPIDGSSPKLPPGCSISAGSRAKTSLLILILLPLLVAMLRSKFILQLQSND